jgi:hypothetical protein
MKMIVINLGITVPSRTVLVDNRWDPGIQPKTGLSSTASRSAEIAVARY